MTQPQLSLGLLLRHFSRARLCVTPYTAPTRFPRPWDSTGKNTGVGCHFLLQCMKVKSESEVAQSCLTLRDPMDYSLPGSSVHGIFQARVLEWVAIAFAAALAYLTVKIGPLQCSFLENPRDGGAWWAAVFGVAQSRTRLQRLSSSSSSIKRKC